MLREYHLRKQGYTIVYLNDPDELRRYCFPFGFNDQEKNRITERKTEAFIADEHGLSASPPETSALRGGELRAELLAIRELLTA